MSRKINHVISIDVESNGLHGDAFAIGGVLLDERGVVQQLFEGRCPILGPVDAWVEKNVIPVLRTMPETDQTPLAMRDRFWTWLTNTRAEFPQAILVADCGWPVEAGMFLACIRDDPAARGGGGPYPLHEVATLLLAAGLDPLGKYASDVLPVDANAYWQPHHPTYDAHASGLIALRCLKKLGVGAL